MPIARRAGSRVDGRNLNANFTKRACFMTLVFCFVLEGVTIARAQSAQFEFLPQNRLRTNTSQKKSKGSSSVSRTGDADTFNSIEVGPKPQHLAAATSARQAAAHQRNQLQAS